MEKNFIEIVENAKKKARIQNIEEVRKDISKPWVQTKIEKHIERFGGIFSREDIEQEIMSSDLTASMFAKDPSKQNIVENLIQNLTDLRKYPASGKNCIRFAEDGSIVHLSGASNTKSADFDLNGYYATQKYTNEAGGAQDNQFKDVVEYLEKGSKKNKVAAIVDGHFWEKGKRQVLENHFKDNPNVLITSMQSLINQ